MVYHFYRGTGEIEIRFHADFYFDLTSNTYIWLDGLGSIDHMRLRTMIKDYLETNKSPVKILRSTYSVGPVKKILNIYLGKRN